MAPKHRLESRQHLGSWGAVFNIHWTRSLLQAATAVQIVNSHCVTESFSSGLDKIIITATWKVLSNGGEWFRWLKWPKWLNCEPQMNWTDPALVFREPPSLFSRNGLVADKAVGDIQRIIIPRQKSLTSRLPAKMAVQQAPQAVTGTCLLQKCWRFICTLNLEFEFRDLIRHYFTTNFIPISEFWQLLEAGCCWLLAYPCLAFSNSCWRRAAVGVLPVTCG